MTSEVMWKEMNMAPWNWGKKTILWTTQMDLTWSRLSLSSWQKCILHSKQSWDDPPLAVAKSLPTPTPEIEEWELLRPASRRDAWSGLQSYATLLEPHIKEDLGPGTKSDQTLMWRAGQFMHEESINSVIPTESSMLWNLFPLSSSSLPK